MQKQFAEGNLRPCAAKENNMRKRVVMFAVKVLYVMIQVALFIFFWTKAQSKYRADAQTTMMLALIYGILLLVFHRVYNALDSGIRRVLDVMLGQVLSVVFCNCLILLAGTLAIKQLPKLSAYVLLTLAQGCVSFAWCIIANRVYMHGYQRARCMAVYSNGQSPESIRRSFAGSYHHELVELINADDWAEDMNALKEKLNAAEAVFLYDLPADTQVKLVRYCACHDIPAYIHPRMAEVLFSTAERRNVKHIPMLIVEHKEPQVFYQFVKRTMDIVVSFVMLVVLSPVLLGVAAAIYLEDRQNVFYKQVRLTRGGREFEILKFRSMRVDAEKDGVARLASEHDDRITRTGHFIRATRLDELPQLINILKGDMSLVGPRPERPEIAAEYEKELPEFRMRLRAKAGLTGYAQVHGRYNTTPADKLQMDLIYIADMSLVLDLKLILQTVQILFERESTQGVAEGQVTAAENGEDVNA